MSTNHNSLVNWQVSSVDQQPSHVDIWGLLSALQRIHFEFQKLQSFSNGSETKSNGSILGEVYKRASPLEF